MARATGGGSRAVETYLRNFEGENRRYSEILEITLCYGVQCLARTYPLKGISCNELRAMTNYDTAKTRDFFVRNASHSISEVSCVLQRTPIKSRPKPPHSWRDGEVEMPDFPESSAMTQAGGGYPEKSSSMTEVDNTALYSLPPVFDEIDFHTKWLGTQLVNLAWKTFPGREGKKLSTSHELDERFIRIDQGKVHSAIPTLPVTTFADFLSAYVTDCVRRSHRMAWEPNENQSDSEKTSAAHWDCEKQSTSGGAKSSKVSVRNGRRQGDDHSRAATGNTNSPRVGTRRTQRPLHPQPQQRQRQVPRSLQHVKSKIHPGLDARRKHILRVKKTQSQRMAETLARARLAEYDARRELQDRHLGSKKMPIQEITKGAAALEIVDDFIKSPLMGEFSRESLPDPGRLEPTIGDINHRVIAQIDPLKLELYGTAALDSSFLGCKSVPERRPRPESRLNKPKRNYNGWLGDFGPLHTKTVRPEWNEGEDVAINPECVKETTFEWNFDHLSGDRPKLQSNMTKTRAHFTEDNHDDGKRLIDDFDDSFSDELSVNLDPVYEWLKDAV